MASCKAVEEAEEAEVVEVVGEARGPVPVCVCVWGVGGVVGVCVRRQGHGAGQTWTVEEGRLKGDGGGTSLTRALGQGTTAPHSHPPTHKGCPRRALM
jgi:hypothetical protein